MKKFLTSFILIICSLQCYQAQLPLKGRNFKALIGSLCAETNEYNPCAGYMIHLVLNFRDQDVVLTEKNVNSCKETVTSRIMAKWKSESNGNILLSYTSKIPKGSFLEGFRLQLKGKRLVGYKKDWQGQMVEYEFEAIK